jgi:hypothetical protein
VSSLGQAERALKRFRAGDDVLLYVVRGGVKFWVAVRAQAGK